MLDIAALVPTSFEANSAHVRSARRALPWRRLVRQVVSPSEPLVWEPPICVFGQPAEWQLLQLAHTPERSEPAFIARLRGVRVIGRGLLLDRRDRLLMSRQFHEFAPQGHRDREQSLWNWLELDQPRPADAVARRAPEELRPLPLPGPSVLLAQPGHRVFGHWLLEVLPRLAVAQQLGLGTLPLLLPQPLPAFAAACLGLLGLSVDQIQLYDVHRDMPCPDVLYVPSRLYLQTHYAPLANRLFDRIVNDTLNDQPRRRDRRLFVSRAQLPPDQRHINREALRPMLERAGFEEVCPETLPLAEQVRLFAEASHVVAEEGSAAHLMLFSPPGLRALLLIARNRPVAQHAAVAQLRGHRLGLIFGEPQASYQGGHIDHHIDPALLERGLALLLLRH